MVKLNYLEQYSIYCANERESRLTWYLLNKLNKPILYEFNGENQQYATIQGEVYWELINLYDPNIKKWSWTRYQVRKKNKLITYEDLRLAYKNIERIKKLERIMETEDVFNVVDVDYKFIGDFMYWYPYILGNPRETSFELKNAILSADKFIDLKNNLSEVFKKYKFKLFDVNDFKEVFDDNDEINTDEEILEAIKYDMNMYFDIYLRDYAHDITYLFKELEEEDLDKLRTSILTNGYKDIDEIKTFCEKNDLFFSLDYFNNRLTDVEYYINR